MTSRDRDLVDQARKAQAARLMRTIHPQPDPSFERSWRRVVIAIAVAAPIIAAALVFLAVRFL
jgi:hypothetical protein